MSPLFRQTGITTTPLSSSHRYLRQEVSLATAQYSALRQKIDYTTAAVATTVVV